MFPEHLIYHRDDQRAAIIQQGTEYIIIGCICYPHIFHVWELMHILLQKICLNPWYGIQ